MKPSLVAAIVLCALALVSTAAYAANIQSERPVDSEIDGVGLLLDTPRTPVGDIYGPSFKLV